MSPYTNIKVNISDAQHDKIKRCVQAGTGVSIKLAHGDFDGEHTLALTQAQVNKLAKAYQAGKGVTIKMSKTQLEYNRKVEGGFIGAILPFLAKAAQMFLPSLAMGAMSGLGSAATSKIVDKISGSGVMYVKKGDMTCKVRAAGSGLYLSPWPKGGSLTASGLYLKTGQGYERDGKGLLLGPNSPFANIPILGMIL